MTTVQIIIEPREYDMEDMIRQAYVFGYDDKMDGDTIEVDVLDEAGNPTGEKYLDIIRIPNTETPQEFIQRTIDGVIDDYIIKANSLYIDKEARKQKAEMEKLIRSKINGVKV